MPPFCEKHQRYFVARGDSWISSCCPDCEQEYAQLARDEAKETSVQDKQTHTNVGITLGHAMQYLNDQSPKNWEAVEILNKAWGEGLREYVSDKKTAPVETSVSAPDREDTCEECGGPNVTWFTGSPLWNSAVDVRGRILCPICFIRRAEKVIICTGWELVPENLRIASGGGTTEVASELSSPPVGVDLPVRTQPATSSLTRKGQVINTRLLLAAQQFFAKHSSRGEWQRRKNELKAATLEASGPLAQLVEHPAHNRECSGSSPERPTIDQKYAADGDWDFPPCPECPKLRTELDKYASSSSAALRADFESWLDKYQSGELDSDSVRAAEEKSVELQEQIKQALAVIDTKSVIIEAFCRNEKAEIKKLRERAEAAESKCAELQLEAVQQGRILSELRDELRQTKKLKDTALETHDELRDSRDRLQEALRAIRLQKSRTDGFAPAPWILDLIDAALNPVPDTE